MNPNHPNPEADPIPAASDQTSPFPEDPLNPPKGSREEKVHLDPDAPGAKSPEAAAPDPAAEAARYRDLALRAQADFENFRKRAAREKEEALRYANNGLLERLLPVLDNFDLGMMAARQTAGAETIVTGMGMVQRQMEDFLRDAGVTTIDATGAKFDPHLHEALGHEASAEVPEGHVVRQLRKGYKLKDRLLRPANVFVSNGAVN